MLSSGGSTNVACGVTCVWALKNASVEGPDQTLQLSRLAGIHAHWTASIAAESVDDIGPRVSAVEVDSHPANYHLTCESPLFRAPKSLVPTDASALQAHKAVFYQETIVLPLVTGGASVVPRSSVTAPLRALAGPVAQLCWWLPTCKQRSP